MNTKLLVLLLLTITSNVVFGQSKKELRSTVLKLQADSTSFERKILENTVTISNLTSEVSGVKELNRQLTQQVDNLTTQLEISNTSLANSVSILDDLTNNFNVKLDSVNTYARVTSFISAFYFSLELSDAELFEHYESRDFKFDLDNFNSLVSKEAKYSKGRVKNLSDQNSHDKYFVMLIGIEEIKVDADKIVVKTQAMYSGERMGLFYNEEELTIVEHKGLLKLIDWVDVDLYKIAPTLEWNDTSFTKEDFYKWIDGRAR